MPRMELENTQNTNWLQGRTELRSFTSHIAHVWKSFAQDDFGDILEFMRHENVCHVLNSHETFIHFIPFFPLHRGTERKWRQFLFIVLSRYADFPYTSELILWIFTKWCNLNLNIFPKLLFICCFVMWQQEYSQKNESQETETFHNRGYHMLRHINEAINCRRGSRDSNSVSKWGNQVNLVYMDF